MAVYRPQAPTEREIVELRRQVLLSHANLLETQGRHYHQVVSNRQEASRLRGEAAAIQEWIIRNR